MLELLPCPQNSCSPCSHLCHHHQRSPPQKGWQREEGNQRESKKQKGEGEERGREEKEGWILCFSALQAVASPKLIIVVQHNLQPLLITVISTEQAATSMTLQTKKIIKVIIVIITLPSSQSSLRVSPREP